MKTICHGSAVVSNEDRSRVLQNFRHPDLDAKPMARMWFPDAGAGETEHDCIYDQLSAMAEGGMGGVEIALLGDDSGNVGGQDYGWGGPNWVSTMKKVLRAAQRIPGGFKVDFTITSHWPPVVNTIDPNDTAASTNMSYTIHTITQENLDAGKLTLDLPKTKLTDSGGHPFLFTDTLDGVVLAKISDKPLPELQMPDFHMPDQSGQHHFGPERTMFEGMQLPGGDAEGAEPIIPDFMRPKHKSPYVLEFSSLRDVTEYASVVPGTGWKAGVPDEEALSCWYDGKYTAADVANIFGPPANTAHMRTKKQDCDFNRRRMADTQSIWQLDLTGLSLEAGNYAVVACYYRGTGQIFSGNFQSRLMKNMTYAANNFTVEGMQAITDYWNRYILSDPELRMLMEKNGREVGGAIFEDSIELQADGAHWGKGFKSQISEICGYDVGKYLPVYAGIYFDDEARSARILEDYHYALGQMYQYNHIGYLNRWTSSFGYQYRAQAGMPGLNIIGANAYTDITEGDNGTFKDSNRKLSAGRVLMQQKFHSFESNTFTGMPFGWPLLIQECHYDASTGTNRVIFHGTAYCKNVHNFYDWWPGWNWGGGGSHAHDFMAWDKRQPWWDDAHVLTDFLSRLQAVMQNGTMRVDLAVFCGETGNQMQMGGGNLYQNLTNLGYSYHILDGFLLDKVLVNQDPGYQAVIVSGVHAITMKDAKKLRSIADVGLPVFFDGCVPDRLFGAETGDQTDTALQCVMDAVCALPNVYIIAGDLTSALAAADVLPSAAYAVSGLEASHYTDSLGDFYLLYNDTSETITAPVQLHGCGTLVRLDCWNGTILPAENVLPADGGWEASLNLKPQDLQIFALLPDVTLPEALTVQEAAPVSVTKWDIQIESFGPALPGDAEYDPYFPECSHRVKVQFPNVPAGTLWNDLPANEEICRSLRVGTMADVSGRAEYSGVFTMPEGVSGASLTILHNEQDHIVGGTINGTPFPVLNCMNGSVELGNLVHSGENTITICMATNLTNRMNYESPHFLEHCDKQYFSFGGGNRDFSIRKPMGITKAVITPYILG